MTQTIQKLHLEETISFAIQHNSHLDPTTLRKLIELVNTTGNYGTISYEELIQKMVKLVKCMPNIHLHSLAVLAELLDLPVTINQLPTYQPIRQLPPSQKYLTSAPQFLVQ